MSNDTAPAARTYTCSACRKTVKGVDQPEHFEQECDKLVAKFKQMLTAEREVGNHRLMAEMGMYPWDRERGARQFDKAKAALSALFDSLPLDEMEAFGRYRQAHC